MMPIPVTEIVSDMSFCFETDANYQAFQELCPFYCVFLPTKNVVDPFGPGLFKMSSIHRHSS